MEKEKYCQISKEVDLDQFYFGVYAEYTGHNLHC